MKPRLGRVLVVEDDPGIALQLVRGLTRAGYGGGLTVTLDFPGVPVPNGSAPTNSAPTNSARTSSARTSSAPADSAATDSAHVQQDVISL